MDDLISRREAVNAALEDVSDKRTHEFNAGATRAANRIKQLPSVQPEQRWIPCSERYPDMDERVLVYTGAHEYHVWDCMSNRADNYFWEDEEGLYRNKYEASLWMPLPEPYRGGEK